MPWSDRCLAAAAQAFCWRLPLAMVFAALGPHASAWALDTAAAEQILQDNKCTKCHAVDRKKDGPAYRDVAAKFRGQADAVTKVIHHMTSGEKVKFPDGHEETHKKVKLSNPDDLKALATWLLALEGGTKY
jgi:cytochrome c